jgi:hypothetical protein
MPDDYPRTYYLSFWVRALVIVLGIGLLAMGALFVLLITSSASPAPGAMQRCGRIHLMLDRWGPRTEPADVTVTRDVYLQAAPRGVVCVHTGPGALTIPWYVVRVCE